MTSPFLTSSGDDMRWIGAALTLAERGVGLSSPNPSVGCVIVKEGRVIGRGWTQKGGRPHAEAVALAQAGEQARGATAYVTLEPCAHHSPRGPACSDSLIAAGVARVVAGLTDPDPRTAGEGFAKLRSAGIVVTEGVRGDEAAYGLAPFLTRMTLGRPLVTIKIACSLDGKIARLDGESQWITGDRARAHAHLERARHDAILVGRGTFEVDGPRLDVRLSGLEQRSPQRFILSGSPDAARDGWHVLHKPEAIFGLEGVQSLLVEGGPHTWSAFVRAGLADRLLLYRAPIMIGAGQDALGDIGLAQLADAHGRWRLHDTRMLGMDRVELYEAAR